MVKKNKRIIKGFSKKIGIILLGTIMATTPINSNANKSLENKNLAQEQQNETDLEKYFNCEIPMDKNYKISYDSIIYKILSYYEGKPQAVDNNYEIEHDPYGNLVVANGLTVKYQPFLIEYLKDYGSNSEEIENNINTLMNSGVKVYIPCNKIDEIIIQEIQKCRDNAIEIAEKYNINLSENQINVLTEMSYRYGKENIEGLFQHLINGGILEDFTIKLQRQMPESQWNETHFKNNVEVENVIDENIIYTIDIKPFNGLGKKITIENLESTDISTSLESAQSDQLEGDWRRCLFRQLGIEKDELLLIKDKCGNGIYWEKGEQKETNILDFLKNIENNIKSEQKQEWKDNNERKIEKLLETSQKNEIQKDRYKVVSNFETSKNNETKETENSLIVNNQEDSLWYKIISKLIKIGIISTGITIIKNLGKKNRVPENSEVTSFNNLRKIFLNKIKKGVHVEEVNGKNRGETNRRETRGVENNTEHIR